MHVLDLTGQLDAGKEILNVFISMATPPAANKTGYTPSV
jgi:hypothetical protein